MPKTVRLGRGTNVRDVVQFDLSGPGPGPVEDMELSQEWLKNIKSPDERREEFSLIARDRLIAWNFPDPEDHFLRLDLYSADGEDSVAYFLAAWLFEYRRVMKFRGDVESGTNPRSMPDLVESAVSLGKLEGRFGFLNQRDPSTGNVWSEMALSAKEHRLKSRYGSDVKKGNSLVSKHGDKLVARANDYFRRNPKASIREFIFNVQSQFLNEKGEPWQERAFRRALRDKKWVKPPG